MEQARLKELVHIVSSKMAKDINKVRKNGEHWYNFFVDNGLLIKGMRVLDYGAGVGRISVPFNRVAQVTAIDGNPDMVQYLKETGVFAHLGTDCTPVLNDKFDFAISSFVLQHMHFPRAQEIVGQIGEVTDVFYFTYPIIEDGGAESYMYYKDSYEIDLLSSHDYSRKMHLHELPVLFERSKFNPSTIKRMFTNLFQIKK